MVIFWKPDKPVYWDWAEKKKHTERARVSIGHQNTLQLDFEARRTNQNNHTLDLHHLDFINDSVCQKTKTELKQDRSICFHKMLYTTMTDKSDMSWCVLIFTNYLKNNSKHNDGNNQALWLVCAYAHTHIINITGPSTNWSLKFHKNINQQFKNITDAFGNKILHDSEQQNPMQLTKKHLWLRIMKLSTAESTRIQIIFVIHCKKKKKNLMIAWCPQINNKNECMESLPSTSLFCFFFFFMS